MARAEALPDGAFERRAEGGGQSVTRLHDEEEEDGFVGVVGPSPADAERVAYAVCEGRGFDDGVDFAAAEADARGI